MSSSAAARKASAAGRRQRRPYRYAFWLVLTSATIVTIALLFANQSVPFDDKLTQIGTGLAASIIFALIYTVFANREFSHLIKAEIADQLSDHLNDILRQIRQLNTLYLPTGQYPATQDFDARFNSDLTRDMSHSRAYFFRGTSAKYVPARLRHCSHHLDTASVMLLDPRDNGTIRARATDRRKRPEYTGKDLPDIAREIRDEILLAVVALFDCRDTCDIELGFSTTTSPVRVEVFDDAIYTSLYRAAESERNTHPETARFSRDSQTYLIFRDEWKRQMQLASPRKIFTASDTDDDLVEFLSTLGYPSVSPTNLIEQRDKYTAFIARFAGALTAIGASG
jgi:hypothetical protein